jgi:hypothetical protein
MDQLGGFQDPGETLKQRLVNSEKCIYTEHSLKLTFFSKLTLSFVILLLTHIHEIAITEKSSGEAICTKQKARKNLSPSHPSPLPQLLLA